MKTVCPPAYHHNGFMATHALRHIYIYIYIYIYSTYSMYSMYSIVYLYIFIYLCIGSISMSSDHRDRFTVRFFFQFFFHLKLKHEVLVFKVFGGRLHKLSHFNSRISTFDFTWNCCELLEARTFWRNTGQFKWVTRKSRYHLFIVIRNLKSQVAELVQRPTIMLKILYFSWGNQFFQISPGISLFMTKVGSFFVYYSGRHNLGLGRQF